MSRWVLLASALPQGWPFWNGKRNRSLHTAFYNHPRSLTLRCDWRISTSIRFCESIPQSLLKLLLMLENLDSISRVRPYLTGMLPSCRMTEKDRNNHSRSYQYRLAASRKIKLLTYHFNVYRSLHRQRKRQDWERIKANTLMVTLLTSHLGLQLSMKEINYDWLIPHLVVLPSFWSNICIRSAIAVFQFRVLWVSDPVKVLM